MRTVASFAATLLMVAALPSSADEVRTERIKFEAGKTQAVISGKIAGNESVVYKLNAKDGQFLKVSMSPENESADYNLYIPGRAPGDEALFTSATGGRKYLGQLYKTGDHSISVFLNRAAARRGETTTFKLTVSVTDKAPPEEPKPANNPKLDAAGKDCVAAVKKQVGHNRVSLISVREGENGIIALVKVEGADKPWRAYHNGTKVTEVEYTGEG